jgi:outer membrane PBP1 activator LpoA protein
LKSRTLKLFLPLCIAILTACDIQPVKPEPTTDIETRPITERQATLTEEAERLIELAEDSDSDEAQLVYRTQAAHLYIEADKIKLAKEQLNILKSLYPLDETGSIVSAETVPGSTLASLSLLTAEIALAEKDIQLAEQIFTEIKPLTRAQQIRFYSLKADIDFFNGNYMFVVDRRVQLDTYIIDEIDKNQNNKKIWAALSSMTTAQLNKQQSSKPVITGWLDLAKVVRTGQQNIDQLENSLLDWGTRHPSHPVNATFLSEIINDYQSDISEVKHIAVLLPMHGDLSNVTATIKNGLLSAYYSDSSSQIKPVIKFYDSSNEDLSFQQLYQQVLDEGATTIIGPLNKTVINQLAQQRELDIPVLTLNYAENAFSQTENLYQFGLSPVDEAHQVAELAIKQDKKRAAVFYPDSEWGKRLNTAFTEHYELLGGKVLTATNYATNTNDYRRPIRRLFNLDQSAIRHRKVNNIIGKNTQTEPYRRQDIDMIFLAATHRSARSIMPAFKFHHAGDLPVYSTSHVYTGKFNRDLDRDLNGLIFCDSPWILQNDSSLASVFTKNWPQQENLTRLFSLGIDAYHLIYNLNYLDNKEYAFYSGQTGNIQLDENNRMTRSLLWARFNNGIPVHFEPAVYDPSTSENNTGDRP